jgi:hypothetical protein
LISKTLEKQATCKSGALTLDGGKFSDSRTTNSLTGRAIRYLMLLDLKTKKDKPLVSRTTTMVLTNNGMYSILMKLKDQELRELTKTSVSTLTDHSISDQECQ